MVHEKPGCALTFAAVRVAGVSHSRVAVHAGVRESGDTDGDVVRAGGSGGGVADPLAWLDVETLAGLHVEGPLGVLDVESSGGHDAIFPIVTVLSDAHPSRGRLHAGDGDLFVAGIDQTDELIGGFVDVADALNDGRRDD